MRCFINICTYCLIDLNIEVVGATLEFSKYEYLCLRRVSVSSDRPDAIHNDRYIPKYIIIITFGALVGRNSGDR